MAFNRQFILFCLHTTIVVLSGFVTVSQQDPRFRNMNITEISDKIRTLTLYIIGFQTYVQNAGPGFDQMLYIIEYAFKFAFLGLAVYFFQGYFNKVYL